MKNKNSKRKKTKPARPAPSKSATPHRPALRLPEPIAASNEDTADIALFDEQALNRLPEELRSQARLVIGALEATYQGDLAADNDCLRAIPRSSPYADWRMLIRGLAAWYADDFTNAQLLWSKLDASRRPSRIASVLAASVPSNGPPTSSESLATNSSTIPAPHFLNPAAEATSVQGQMIDLVSQIRDARPALQLARKIATVKHRDNEITLSPLQVSHLLELRNEYLNVEPLLVQEMTTACVNLAKSQSDVDVFRLLIKRLPGPPHDPTWSLTIANFFAGFEDSIAEHQRFIKQYLDVDLPNNQQIDPTLKNAITSVVHQQTARHYMTLRSGLRGDAQTLNLAVDSFEKAVAAWPTDRDSYLGILSCLDRIKDINSRYNEPTKESREQAEAQSALTYNHWLAALPDDLTPRLWLINYHLDNGDCSSANKLILKLPISALDNFRVKLLPFRVKLADAFALAKTKRGIAAAQISLNEAVALWPQWLSRDFQAFLYAAWKTRAGDTGALQADEITSLLAQGMPKLVADVMKLAASQMMSVEAGVISPLRNAVMEHLKNIESLSTTDLIRLCSFFWELKLCGLSYPAQRMHGSKFGLALCNYLGDPKLADHPEIYSACFWASDARFYPNSSYDQAIPEWLESRADSDPLAATAILRSYRLGRYNFRFLQDRKAEVELVKRALKVERNEVLRALMEETLKLTEEIEQEAEKVTANPFGDFFSGLEDLIGAFGGEPDTCMCPKCVERRARENRSKFDDHDDFIEDDDDYDDDDDDYLPGDEFLNNEDELAELRFQVLMERLGPESKEQFNRLIELGERTNSDVTPQMFALLRRHGISQQEFLDTINMDRKKSKKEMPQPEQLTAEERRQRDKQRKKLLEQSRKRR